MKKKKREVSAKTLAIYFALLCVTALIMVYGAQRLIVPNFYKDTSKIPGATNTPTPNVDKTLTLTDVNKYNGSDPNLPIYMVYEGYVYDVTAGKNFYAKGHVYNYLVGRDATKDLNMVGLGGLIKSKYPVVAKVAN